MKINLIAVGSRMPVWVESGCNEYIKRLPKGFSLNIIETPLAQRTKTTDIKRAIEKEGQQCLQALKKGDYVVALDVLGRSLSTELLAKKVNRIREGGQHLSLLVGGPDGLSKECLNRADETWSLSALTMPHPIVRVVVAEQLYRVWSLLNKHPYHRS